jgi:hypothetical protein
MNSRGPKANGREEYAVKRNGNHPVSRSTGKKRNEVEKLREAKNVERKWLVIAATAVAAEVESKV